MALTEINRPDSVKSEFGTGNDLELYFDGTHSRLVHTPGTGDLVIQSDDLYLTNGAGSEYYLRGIANGAVELYHNNTEMFYTSASGCHVGSPSAAAHLHFLDGGIARFGAGNDLSIFHNGTDSFIDSITGSLKIRSNAGNMAVFTPDGTVELYHNESLKFWTRDGGVQVTGYVVADSYYLGDSEKFYFGNGNDLQLYHDGSDSYIVDSNAASDLFINSNKDLTLKIGDGAGGYHTAMYADNDGAVRLYHNNIKKFETYAGGCIVTGQLSADQISLGDGEKILLGTGDDVEIYHDASDTHLVNKTGILYIKNNNKFSLGCWQDGKVAIYYNDSKKFETDTDGVQISGILQAHHDLSDSAYTAHAYHNLHHSTDDISTAVFEHSGNSTPYGIGVNFSDAAPDDSTRYFIRCGDSAAARCYVYSDGDLWNHDNSYTGSDQTLKENIVDATSKLEDIKKLKVRNFNWKADYFPEKSKKKQLGFIAQEVEQVFPSLISEHDIAPGVMGDGHTPVMKKAIKQAWDPIIIKAMQELITKIEILETKVAALEAV